jgi:hypothetical protein
LAEDIMSAWERSLEALDSTLRRKFDDDEDFEDEDLEDEDEFDDEELEEFEDFDEEEEKE